MKNFALILILALTSGCASMQYRPDLYNCFVETTPKGSWAQKERDTLECQKEAFTPDQYNACMLLKGYTVALCSDRDRMPIDPPPFFIAKPKPLPKGGGIALENRKTFPGCMTLKGTPCE